MGRIKNNIFSKSSSCKIVFVLLFCICSFKGKADTHLLDSVRHIIETTDNDTLKINCWNSLSLENSNRGYYIIAEKSAYEALALANKIGFEKGIADAYYHLGISFSRRSKYDKAIEHYLKAIPVYEKLNDKDGVSWSVMLIAVVDYYLANKEKAEKGYLRSLAIFEETKNRIGQANCLINLAILYNESGEYDNSIKYSEKAYKLFENSSSHGRAVCLANIANCYSELYLKSLEKGDKDIADEYKRRAEKAFNENIKTYTELGMPVEKSTQYIQLFKVNLRAKNYSVAKNYLDSARAVVKDLNNLQASKTVSGNYYDWYISQGDSVKALKYYLDYTAAKDSLFNSEQAEKMDDLNLQFAELEKQKEIDLLTKEKEKRGLILWGVGLLAVLAIAFSVLFFKRFREKQSANLILSDKNKIIEEKNKEITDSIRYAKRIQTALLPSDKYVEKNISRLRDVTYKPKS